MAAHDTVRVRWGTMVIHREPGQTISNYVSNKSVQPFVEVYLNGEIVQDYSQIAVTGDLIECFREPQSHPMPEPISLGSLVKDFKELVRYGWLAKINRRKSM